MTTVSTTQPVARLAPAAPTPRINAAPAARAALSGDAMKLSAAAKAQAPAPVPAAAAKPAEDQTFWQKAVKRGMAGLGGTVGAAAFFIGIIAALEFGIGVPAAHAVLPLAAPLMGFAGALLGGWLGFRQGKKWVG